MENLIFYIHIGTWKTGTTALQTYLSQNRTALREKGFLYPGTEKFHHALARELLDIKKNIRQNEGDFLHQVKNEIESSNCRKIIISSEVFYSLRIQKFLKSAIYKTFGDNLTIKIVVYLRRQDHLIESAYQHRVSKAGHPLTFKEFLEKDLNFSRLEYDKNLSLWASSFGKENIIVRCFEKEQLPDGIIPDFLSVAGLSLDQGLPLPEKNVINVGFDMDSTEIMRLCYVLDPEVVQFLRKYLRITQSRGVHGEYGYFSPEERIKILTRYARVNSNVAEEYLSREDGRLFYEPWPDINSPYKPYQGITLEKFIPIFVKMLFAINRDANSKFLRIQEQLNSTDHESRVKG